MSAHYLLFDQTVSDLNHHFVDFRLVYLGEVLVWLPCVFNLQMKSVALGSKLSYSSCTNAHA